ncbi:MULTISPECIES: glycosyl hydrolase family 8 [unclassified Fibrobacter]|uniref:glycosyl hydrolase family 8 n=1 Tax=unclassified Fibrobacter TaxID=2634177 RepID=UPI000D6BD134|nr:MULTISPECIES: glycosyl hydrolase family 8 [unclassified Fibrobacter]PWJ56505.1 oligosaccharide reducing-end xylanase [Fibrobacter sp. UWR4]PZW62333.1 oligosaccharide reducing-end xylanase [Fibrobacter sp. UWR1]
MKNIFEQIGKTPAEIEAKLDKAFSQLFEGDAENERICFEKGDEAYVVDIGHNDIRSEGMSYGMTIAALLNKRDLFEKLWNFATRHMKNTEAPYAGYYAWQVSTSDFSIMDPGSAPDGEEYFAAALLYGAKVFNSAKYKQDAVQLINDMAHKPTEGPVHTMMDVDAGLVRFSPMDGNDFTDPSYNTVAFYRMYGEATGDDIWKKIADNSFNYLKKAVHPVTGIAAEYSEYDGTPKSTPWYPESNCFCGDAWRVAWNMGLDAANIQKVLDAGAGGNETATLADVRSWEISAIRRLLGYLNSRRPYPADMRVDGSAFPREARPATGGLIAMNAAATIALPQGDPLIRPFAEDLWNMDIPSGLWRYYDGTLYMLGLLACSGKFDV